MRFSLIILCMIFNLVTPVAAAAQTEFTSAI